MPKRKGVSLEEKQERILSIYTESQSVFNLKEIEKLGTQKGVVTQTIKDVNQMLIDDGKIDTDKIGAGNFYWSFASKQSQQLEGQLADAQSKVDRKRAELDQLQQQIIEARALRKPTPQRAADIATLSQHKKRKTDAEARLLVLRDSDPAVVEALHAKVGLCVEGANRWTDNIWCLKDYCTKKFNLESNVFDKEAGVPADLDYVEA